MGRQIDLSSGGGLALRALGFVPGPVGMAAGLLGAGVRGSNMGYTNSARRSWGQDGLSFGQTVGGLLGMNSYGGGGQRDKLGDFRGVAVSPAGMVSQGGFLGFGATPVGAYTPGEAQKRYAASLYGNSFGTPPVGTVTPTPVQPTASVPNRPVPMGASGNGGGRSSGGGRGRGSVGGGRSDRSSMSSGRG